MAVLTRTSFKINLFVIPTNPLLTIHVLQPQFFSGHYQHPISYFPQLSLRHHSEQTRPWFLP